MNRYGFTLTDDEVIRLAHTPDAVTHLFLRDLRRDQINMEETIMDEIERLRAAIEGEVAQALASMQARVDEALAAAEASDAQRDAVASEFDNYKVRAADLAADVEAEGLYGQDADPEPEPTDPEPTEPEPTEPEPTEPEPTEPEPTGPEPSEPGTSW